MGANGGGVKFQYLAGISVNIVTLSYGIFVGWLSGSALELVAEDTPLPSGPLSDDQIGWVGSILCIGGIFGSVFFAWYTEKVGRKRCMLLVALPLLIGWVLIPFAQSPIYLYASRFFGGVSGGGCFAVIPSYIAELAEESVRGTLGTFLVLACNSGMLVGYVLGYYFDCITAAWIGTTLPFVFLIWFAFLPETPQQLIKQNKVEEAENALRYYRNIRSRPSKELTEDLQYELKKLRTVEKSAEECAEKVEAATWRDLCDPTVGKAFFIGLGLMFLNQFCGCFAMLNYTAKIFEAAGSSLSPKLAAIVVGAIQTIGTYMSTVLVDRAGRKLLMLVSSVGAGLGLAAMGVYSYLSYIGYDVKDFGWVPVASFSFLVLLACVGVLTLPFVIISEIMPAKVRDLANMILMNALWLFAFLLIKGLPFLQDTFGMHGMMFIFSSCCFAGTIFIAVFMPETKGKSIDAILASL